MIRNVLGSIAALAGATAAVWSPFRAWYDGRHGRDYRIEDLFGGITDTKSDLWISVLLPFVVAAVITLLGLVFRSRLLVAIAGVIVLGFTILWMVQQGQEAGSLTAGGNDSDGLGSGVGLALGGGLLLLLGAAIMSGRRRTRRTEAEPAYAGDRGHPDDRAYPDERAYPDDRAHDERAYPDDRFPDERPYPDDRSGERPTSAYPTQGDPSQDTRAWDNPPRDQRDDWPPHDRRHDGPPGPDRPA